MTNPSFKNVRKFIEAWGSTSDTFCVTTDVYVTKNKQTYDYNDITVQINYHYGTEDYEVLIYWEEDEDADNYKKLGLHGTYSTNFQKFTFSDALKFTDGKCKVTVTVSSVEEK